MRNALAGFSDLELLSDEVLLGRYREHAGLPQAQDCIEVLVLRYQDRVKAWCQRLTRDPASAGDLAQDVFLKALERQDAQRRLREAMHLSLSDTESRVVVLHYSHGLPLAKISVLLKLRNAIGAKAYLVSAKRKLIRKLNRHEGARSSLRRLGAAVPTVLSRIRGGSIPDRPLTDGP